MHAADARIRCRFVVIADEAKAASLANRKTLPASTGKHQASILRLVECAALAIVLTSAVLVTQSAQAQTHNVLHSFTGVADGATPYAGLVRDASGNLYGTTTAGGASNRGTVFKLYTTGKETLLHSFTGGADGATPYAPLVLDPSGNLYGTATAGGASNSGTVFKVDTTGAETVLYTFTGGADGKTPDAPLVLDPSGNLYGTTSAGGATNSGIVFKLDTTGAETVLYTFSGGADGKTPTGGLVRDAAGNLYGTTNDGGRPRACFLGYVGCGVVFKLDTTGTETVLYTFTGGTDGGNPYYAGLVRDASGNLYGTTSAGGASDSGTVFKLDTTGTETVLYSFGNGGVEPFAGLVRDAAGNLYGTTTNGGSGFGTVFKLDTSGTETLLHTFAGGADGATSYAGLVLDAAGNLYGTTTAGGDSSFGTVFEIALAPAFSVSASGLTPSTVSPGGSSTATVNITATSAFSGSVALSCSVQPSPAMAPKCSISPGSITPGNPAMLTVSTTGATASTSHSGSGSEPLYALWLPLIGVAGVGFGSDKRRKGKSRAVAVACVFAALVFGVACGGGSTNSSGGSGGTPAGTYVIRVTGTSVSSQQSTTTTLTVQ
jgi:uncharacterized repeat protein (TIGR03803 family)